MSRLPVLALGEGTVVMAQRGRKPIDPDGQAPIVHVAMPSGVYDRIYAEARRDGISIPERIRRAIDRDLRTVIRQPQPSP